MKKQPQIEEGTFIYSQKPKQNMAKKKKFYLTVPIYYINGEPTVGHAYTTIIGDIIIRWHKLKNEDTFFLTGTDENSQKTVEASIKLGFSTPQKFTDYMAQKWIEAWKALNIEVNEFVRTTEQRHKELVEEFIHKIQKNKDIYKGVYRGLYCTGCEAFVNVSDLTQDGLCPLHKSRPKEIEENNYFFRLSKYQDKLLKYIEENPGFIEPETRKREIISFIKSGLKDTSISREGARWGIPFPGDEKHKIFVWVDALFSYNHPKKYWPADIHLMAKDIVRFHAILYPALLMSAGYELPKKVFAHGFFTVNGQKMSKSLGNVIDPIYLTKIYGVDALRYFYAREIPFGQDGDFSEESLKNRLNNELANELGNLVSRTLTLVIKKLNSEIKKDKTDKELFKNLNVKKIDNFMEKLEINNAIAGIFGFIQDCNYYINEKAPWQLEDKKELNFILYNLVDAIRIISILIHPFMPSSSEKINKQVNLTKQPALKDCRPGLLHSTKVEKVEILFKKVLTKEEEKEEAKFSSIKCSVDQDVSKLGIKVKFAEIIGVDIKKKHMGLEKLKDEIEKNAELNHEVVEGYEKVYKKLGLTNVKCSVYNLMDLVNKGGKLPTINTAVDSYNLISLKYSLVVGAHDREKLKGNVRVKILNGTEFYIPMGKDKREEVNTGEFGFVDDEKVLCRLDIKQGDQTKITENTKNIIVYVQGNENTSDEYLLKALEEICNLIIKFCGGEYRKIE